MSNQMTVTKPECTLIGEDGNVFSIIGRVKRALVRAGLRERADEFVKKAMSADSYGSVLNLAIDYVEIG